MSLDDNIEQWRDHSVLWQCWLGGPSAFESEWQHWTVKRSLCALTVFCTWGVVHLPLSLNDNIEHWRDQLCVLTVFCTQVWSLYLWGWMKTLNSEEITLCSDSVHLGGPSVFQSQWLHWTVKRSLCAQTVLTRGFLLPLRLNDNIEQWRDHSVLWQCFAHRGSICLWVWMTTLNSEEITLCSDSVLGGVHLPMSLDDNIEQWRDHSVLWQCWLGGPSAFESEWQHWTVKRSLCALTVLTGGWSICLWVWMTTLNIEEINLCSDSVLHIGCPSTFESEWQHWTVKRSLYALTVFRGVHLSFSLNGYIEQWRDHSVLRQCWRGSFCLWGSMTTLNSEEITLCSDSVLHIGGPSAFESEWQHWTVKR